MGDHVMLATAMFVTGSDLHPGMNYLIAIRSRSLVIFGPIETDPPSSRSSGRSAGFG